MRQHSGDADLGAGNAERRGDGQAQGAHGIPQEARPDRGPVPAVQRALERVPRQNIRIATCLKAVQVMSRERKGTPLSCRSAACSSGRRSPSRSMHSFRYGSGPMTGDPARSKGHLSVRL